MLTRDNIKNGVLQDMIGARGASLQVLSDAELEQSWTETLAAHPEPGADIWIFGYGSLIWNPAFRFAEKRIGRLCGYHRRFCLWTHLGRGTPDQPGMVLGLERGGSCRGLVFRIAAQDVAGEIEIIWRREMVSGAYRPRWTKVEAEKGSVTAISFIINPAHPRYACKPPEADIVKSLAHARGPLGAAREYLDNTVEHLEALDICDRNLHRLRHLVAREADTASQNHSVTAARQTGSHMSSA